MGSMAVKTPSVTRYSHPGRAPCPPCPPFRNTAQSMGVSDGALTRAGFDTSGQSVVFDGRTGEQKWMYALDEGERATRWAPRQLSGRGLSYWTDGKEERVIYVTPGYQMVALDAKTGDPVQGFDGGG